MDVRGLPPVYHRLMVRGKRISAIAAICSDGLLGVDLTCGSVNGGVFVDFVRGTLIPSMNSFDGANSRSIVVLDNCSIHHIPEVFTLFQEAGILFFFLPPYTGIFKSVGRKRIQNPRMLNDCSTLTSMNFELSCTG